MFALMRFGPWIAIAVLVLGLGWTTTLWRAADRDRDATMKDLREAHRNIEEMAQACEAAKAALSAELDRQKASRRRAEAAREGGRKREGDTAGSRAERVLDGLRGSAGPD